MQRKKSQAVEENPPKEFDDEIDLLDLLLIFSQKIKVLLLWVVLGVVVGSVYFFMKPPQVESVSLVRIDIPINQNTFGNLETVSKVVRENLVTLFNEGDEFSKIIEPERVKFSGKINAELYPKGSIIKITATAPTTESAQKLNQAALDAVFRLSKPKDTSGNYLQETLENLTGDSVIQKPTAASQSKTKKLVLYTILGGILFGFMGLFFVFIGHSLSASANNPESQSKMQQIKRNLGFGRGG